MEPAETGGVLATEDRLMGFAVVFEGPHGIPEICAGGGHHAALTGGAEDLVLAEAPGSHITEAAQGLAIDPGTMGLGAVFDHGDAVGTGQIGYGGHVCGPATQVHHGDGLSAGGNQRSNGSGGDRTGIGIHIGKHGLGAQQHSAGGGGDESAWRSDQFIAGPKANGQVGSREGEGSIGRSDGELGAAPLGELLLKGRGFLTGPGVHLAGGEDAGSSVDLVCVEIRPGGQMGSK